MPIQTVAAKFNEIRIAGASTGVSLTTTAAFTSFHPGSQWCSLTPRNFSTAVTVLYRFSPWLTVLRSHDALATEPVDASYLLQDGDTTVTLILNSFGTLAGGDAIYVGSHLPFGGLHVDVANANGTSSTLAVDYIATGNVLTTLSITDNTDTGASFAQDGTITWTVPVDWMPMLFQSAFNVPPSTVLSKSNHYQQPLYWVRLSWNNANDSATSISQLRAIGRGAHSELVSGQAFESSVRWGTNGISGVEALTDAGTANLVIQNGVFNRARFGAPAAVAL